MSAYNVAIRQSQFQISNSEFSVLAKCTSQNERLEFAVRKDNSKASREEQTTYKMLHKQNSLIDAYNVKEFLAIINLKAA